MSETHELHASKLFNLDGYVAVVTGGGTGIGLMAAQGLAANGAKVYIVSRREEAVKQAAKKHSPNSNTSKGQIIPLGGFDVTSKKDLERLCQELEKREKYINLLITAAGISGPKNPPEETKASEIKDKLWTEEFDEWNNVFTTNVHSVYFTAVALLPLLQAGTEQTPSHSSSIITISSMSGIMSDAQGHFAYNASKGGTVHLTKLLAKEFAKLKVRVNSIAPGYFPSEMTTQESNEKQKSHIPAEKIQDKGHVPAERPGKDEEIASAVLFLTKNTYVNGEILSVDGGALLEKGSR
jgi:NAD(P)-dependent dehydrogenase (short-subunit alcohol dehydrogenase family)